MAAQVLIDGAVGAGLGGVVSLLLSAITHVIGKTWLFKPYLIQIQETLTRNKSIFDEIDKYLGELDRPREEKEMFITDLKNAEALVRKCLRINWKFYKMYTYALELEAFNASLSRFCQTDVQLLMYRDVLHNLQVTTDVQNRMIKRASSSGVPLLNSGVIALKDRIRALKTMLMKDSEVDDCSVVVVSAGGGWGKTTLVQMLCHDHEIKRKFGGSNSHDSNIYFATVSENPDLKFIIKKLLNQDDQQLDLNNDDDAIQKWGSFLRENESEKLLVLDDVWSHDIVERFMFKLRGYKILVTSRNTFKRFKTYHLQLLNNEEATLLFRHSAFGSECTDDIRNDLVDKLVKCCKNHPLSLSVIGGLLKGTEIANWHHMLKNLSQGNQSILDLNERMLPCLARSLDVLEEESVIKQCYLDLGLFPEDHKIAATLLVDMWVHLYTHDEEGLDTTKQLFELTYKNLATLLPISGHMIANWCEEKSVMQHDLMRTLAIRLSSQGPAEHRKRLIINANEHLPTLPQSVNAHILSITTDERFSLEWNDIQASKVEVFVLNFMSKKCELPRFMQYIEKLKVLIITNYGYHLSELENFPPPRYLSSLTTIRLDHVSISSTITSILGLKKLRKLSLIMCKIGNSFNDSTRFPNKLPNLVELVIDSCDDLVTFPAMLCNLVLLETLSITKCHNLTSLAEEFGNLTNLKVLRLASCLNLKSLPESLKNLEKLSIIDVSDCLSLHMLPQGIGELGSLKTIYVSGCRELHELPESIKDLSQLKVYCDTENSSLWTDHQNVEVEVVEEDPLHTFNMIVPNGYKY